MSKGLIISPINQGIDWVLGQFTGIQEHPVLMPGGHGWGVFKPLPEYQNKNGFETYNCTNYGTYNALETLAAFKGFDDFPKDCAERYSGVHTGTTQQGNDIHHACEVIRTVCGAVPEASLPFTDDITTWDAYYTVDSATWLLPFGQALLKRFKISHEWVINSSQWFDTKPDLIKEALQHGTVSVSVYAWKTHDGVTFYKNDEDRDEHWVQLLDYDEGKSWTIFDSYDNFVKTLEWHYNFQAAKVFYIDRIPVVTRTWWQQIIDNFAKL